MRIDRGAISATDYSPPIEPGPERQVPLRMAKYSEGNNESIAKSDQSYFVPSADFTNPTTASNAVGSEIAISESILRSSSIFALPKPLMNSP